jgi:hypothetical protein
MPSFARAGFAGPPALVTAAQSQSAGPWSFTAASYDVDERRLPSRFRAPSMLPDTPDVAHISNVISQSTGPAFVLGAVASFLVYFVREVRMAMKTMHLE